MDAKNLHIGEYVEKIIRMKGLQKTILAEKMGVTRQSFREWLKSPDMSVKRLYALSEAMEYDLVSDIFHLHREGKIQNNSGCQAVANGSNASAIAHAEESAKYLSLISELQNTIKEKDKKIYELYEKLVEKGDSESSKK